MITQEIILLLIIYSSIHLVKTDEFQTLSNVRNDDEPPEVNENENKSPGVEAGYAGEVKEKLGQNKLSEANRINFAERDTLQETTENIKHNVRYAKTILQKLGRNIAAEKEAQWDAKKSYKALSTKYFSEKMELTQDQRGEELYKKASELIESTQGNKKDAYEMLIESSTLGNKYAMLKIGWSQLFGTHVRQNLLSAKSIFQELAAQGFPDAHTGLGFLYAAGIVVNASSANAIVHYMMGALGGSTWALMALGYRYWAQITLNGNCEKPLKYYKMVANTVAKDVRMSGGSVIHRARLLDEADNPGYNVGILDNDLIDYYQLLAEKGDVVAQVGLGQLHYQGGRGVVQDHEKARNYFLQAADSGNAVAMAFLGRIYFEGRETIKADHARAYKYFKKAADLGNPVGQSGLGMMYLEGIGVEKDYSKALRYFLRAADQGWVGAQLQLGIMHFSGLGIKKDYKLANKYFTQASQTGHVLAYYYLAQMHAAGAGIMRSCTTALELYKNVAERGKWGEKLMEGHTHYKNGRFNESFVHYAFLAELGYEVAQSNAAHMIEKGDYYLGNGNRHDDLIRAKAYWARAAFQGYAPAQIKLGDYYYYGLGTNVDYEVAAMHYRMASNQHQNAQAMFNLGYMHERGLGMRQDMHLAKRWYDLAAESSTDAKIPVLLALTKLAIISAFVYLFNAVWRKTITSVEVILSLREYWDLYLITVLIGLLSSVIYFRRPQLVRRYY